MGSEIQSLARKWETLFNTSLTSTPSLSTMLQSVYYRCETDFRSNLRRKKWTYSSCIHFLGQFLLVLQVLNWVKVHFYCAALLCSSSFWLQRCKSSAEKFCTIWMCTQTYTDTDRLPWGWSLLCFMLSVQLDVFCGELATSPSLPTHTPTHTNSHSHICTKPHMQK